MNSQKRLLLTLKYLWEKTDEEHPATLKEIGEYLQQNGIETTRKTLQADINLLTEFGIDVICNHSTQNQYHIGERVFEIPEVKLLVDAVQSARFITAKKSKTFIMSCVWLNYMVQYFQYKNCVGSSPKTKKCVASFLVPGYKSDTDFDTMGISLVSDFLRHGAAGFA